MGAKGIFLDCKTVNRFFTLSVCASMQLLNGQTAYLYPIDRSSPAFSIISSAVPFLISTLVHAEIMKCGTQLHNC
jgi:hypothetical protein